MSPTTWRRVQRAFEDALELPRERRERFLDETCAGDERVRREVERLLGEDSVCDGFLEHAGPPSEIPSGARLGPYVLHEVLGRGGFGVVYRGEQVEPVRREVAVKILLSGADHRRVVARFEAERQALALMEHPGIAKVFDAGTSDDGRPYFVMELVRGEPLTRFCDRRRLSLEARLALLRDVGHAVQHAHQKGVVHRDLKPTNVLVEEVDGVPRPKVIDFGIAKATGPPLSPETLAASDLLGTPEYMSPEQATSTDDVDTRADVYSLGVLLYELVAGVPPHDPERLRAGSLADVLHIVCEAEPPRPSTRLAALGAAAGEHASARSTTVARLLGRLRTDLDWVVAKAIAKDRARRYPTAAALADDLQRVLDGEPVSAGPPTLRYRWKKFLGRHRVGALAFVLVLAATAVAAVVSFVAAALTTRAQAETARLQAAAERQLYTMSVQRAELALSRNDTGNALRALGEAAPRLRGWEWEHLRHRADRSSAAFDAAGHSFGSAHAFHPGGELLAASFVDDTIRLVDARTGAEVVRFDGHAGRPAPVAFDPDGRLLFAGTHAGELLAWDAASGRVERHLHPHGGRVSSVVLVPGRGELATAGWDGTLFTWALPDLGLLRELRFEHPISFTRIGPDGARAAVALFDQTLRVVDLERGEELLELSCARPDTPRVAPTRWGNASVVEAAFSPGGELLASATMDGRVTLWDLSTGEALLVRDGDGVARSVAFHPDGARLAASWQSGQVRLFGIGEDFEARIEGHAADARTVRFSPDGELLVTASLDGTMRLSDARDGALSGVLRGHRGGVYEASLSPDGTRLFSSGEDGAIRFWELARLTRDVYGGHAERVGGLAYVDRRHLAGVTRGGTLFLLDLERGREAFRVPGVWRENHQLAVDGAAGLIVTAAGEGTLRVHDSGSGRRLFELETGLGDVTALAIAPGGGIAAGDRQGRLETWNPETRARETLWPDQDGRVAAILFGPGAGEMLTVTEHGRVRVWDRTADVPPRELASELAGEVLCAAFDPERRTLAVGSAEVVLLDPATGARAGALEGHAGRVASVAWLSDGTRILTADEQGALRVWDATTLEPVAALGAHDATLRSLAVAPDGSSVATGGHDGRVVLWRTGELAAD